MTHLTLITGASRGLGAAMAAQRLRQGHHVIGISRQASAELAALVATGNAMLTQWKLDLAEPEAAASQLAAWLAAQDGKAFASATLINNAGVVTQPGPLEGTPLAEASRGLRVGLEAPLLLSAAFLLGTATWPGPRKLLNISSGLGRRAMAGSAVYCAAKAGMDHFARAVALEQAALPNGARIVSLAPGIIDTDMQGQLRGADPAAFPERERFTQFKSQGQLDSPEVAAAKVLAYLDRADFGANPVADVRDA
ncbi:MAG TPA: SDR family NAD(P)-dependent oxidoreductase [Ideonella sp.]|uniref:SDR family NAD(P)-dependent oxidoreductase n=1 Tax=Ideonella sp. TaxID=1929293 RepID=UPI002E2FABCD|nr:SDR family NAD(P)-dependent oxidoreductase [Ideonella sp.]HEX5687406.1 SDR family NAD(P)-dependent oxidoreductase [Ideonella sp.]